MLQYAQLKNKLNFIGRKKNMEYQRKIYIRHHSFLYSLEKNE